MASYSTFHLVASKWPQILAWLLQMGAMPSLLITASSAVVGHEILCMLLWFIISLPLISFVFVSPKFASLLADLFSCSLIAVCTTC